MPVTSDYAAGGSFTPTCGTSESGNGFMAAGEVTAMCRREADEGASERGTGMLLHLASCYQQNAGSTNVKTAQLSL